ncbi:MAG: hypothetical protein ACLRNI_08940 [Sutterella wadsworthensis]
MLGGFGAEANDNLLVEGELRSVSNRRQKTGTKERSLAAAAGF